MAGFLYFAPVASQPSLAMVREWGLSYAFAAEPAVRQAMGATPSKSNGWVFADKKRLGDREVKIDLENQVWRKIPGRDGQQEVWVGYWKDAKPTPADLARPEMLSGYPIKMADGQEWLVPVVRAFDTDCGKAVPLLPILYDLDDKGQLTQGEVASAHRWLWDLTEPAWQAMITGAEVSDQSLLSIASRLIGANYVVDIVELAAMLQVFSPQVSPSGITALAIDCPTWQEWAASKKKEETHPGTSDGLDMSRTETDESQITPQPVLTS